ncbi:type VII secretion integral membrane protein EccD [Nocardia sp. CA-084685]|uniref:type VII secretion integral membrane protein EccD n=1 Tax=Nocardia sp. CA-084685 TaxID=3239970 RepID=UPI003D977248
MSEALTSDPVTAGPDLCRVSVVGGNTQIDVGLPTTVPLGEFIADVVDMVESRDHDPTESEDAPIPARHWTLARLGHDPISPDATLTEAGVFDGELLVLRAVGTKDAPTLFDDVIDAVARLTESTFRGWNAASAAVMGQAAAVVAAVGALVLLVVAKQRGSGVVAGSVAEAVGLAALVAALIMARKYAVGTSERGNGTFASASVVLSLCALALVGPGAALFVPDALGPPHTVVAVAVTLVVAVAAYRLTGVGATVFAAVITLSVFGVGFGLVTMLWHNPLPKVGAGLLVAALAAVSAAARVAMAAARLPVPPVPTAGGAIDPADHEPRPTIEGIGAIGATALPSAVGLAERARVANEYQSGFVIGATIAATAGAVLAADPGGAPRWQGVTLALIAGVLLCLRGRAFADRTQACALIMGGCLTLLAVLLGLGFGSGVGPITAAGALLGAGAVAMVVGVGGPLFEISPVARRAGEIVEYLMIVAIGPLVFWIMDFYAAARGL